MAKLKVNGEAVELDVVRLIVEQRLHNIQYLVFICEHSISILVCKAHILLLILVNQNQLCAK